MIKKTFLSTLLTLCLCLSGFAKGSTVHNPFSKWQKIFSQANEHLKAGQNTHSHAKSWKKPPYVVATLDWSTGASAYVDSTEKILLTWKADSTPKKVTIYYNQDNPMTRIVIDSFRFISGGAEFNELEILGDWLPITAKSYAKVLGQWVLVQQYTFTFSSRGMEQSLTEDWTGSAWVNSEREFYLFDTHDMPLGYLNQEWKSGDWSNVDGQRVDYTYDGDDNPVEAVMSEMLSGATDWTTPTQGITKEVYTMNIYEEVGSALIYWADGSADSIGDITWRDYEAENEDFLHIGGSDYEEYTAHIWDVTTSMWIPVGHFSKAYNTSDMVTEEIGQVWDENTSQWVNESRTTHEYYGNDGSVKERLDYDWDGSKWEMSFGERYTNSYDGDDDLIAQTYDIYNGTDWTKISKTIYSYTAPSGINSLEPIGSVNLYPNPASSTLVVDLAGAGKNSVVSIFAVNGQLVSTTTTADSKINLNIENLTAGAYILRVQSGSTVQTGRFVKR